MSIEERIKGISVACNPSGESMRHKAATLAAEADELMREMETAIDGLIGVYALKNCDDAMKSDECHSACEILERYRNWGEKNQ